MKYTIKSGDTLAKISYQYKTPLKSIIYANNITNPDTLNVGDIIIIPDEKDNPFSIEIVLKNRILKLLSNDKVIKHYPVAIGKPSTPTPKGSWKIIKKGLWGDQFGGYFMQLSVPWGIYGIHGTNKPWSVGTRASNGCIRMYSNQAAELYSIIPLNTPVLIY
ncbi:L,D-transpeptidase family protein [Vallitalea guaymasensis]|uniref:L,D-transpeptidase family protein n=1 Tax=Vallitalea guaymasensis TaxID=1185412 RepID=UPI000DE3BBCF|nr:L,D-transpeptidase family protein [Vallitalea guaymasensis]